MVLNDTRSVLFPLVEQEQAGEVALLTFQLWKLLASEVIPIIGQDGFMMLYSRSLYMTHSAFPWIALSQGARPDEPPFMALKTCLEGRSFAEADAASKSLFANFTDILVNLIGEPLTTGILRAALGKRAARLNEKEFPS